MPSFENLKKADMEVYNVIEDELKRQGICEGDYVKMLNWTFEWYQ